jgi:hypothetical protein
MNTTELDTHIAAVMKQIGEAARKDDLAAIQRLSKRAAELKELKEQAASIQQRIASLTSEPIEATPTTPATQPKQANGAGRALFVQVSDGMIRQNLLTLTPHVKRRKIGIGEQLVIEALPSGERFQTEVLDKGNKLRARGQIARFYHDAKVRPDDYVVLTETTPGKWTLRKASPGENGFHA